MLNNLNESYLLKYISNNAETLEDNKMRLIKTINSVGGQIKFSNNCPVYDIIDSLHYASLNYEK